MALSEAQHLRNILAIRIRCGADPELIEQARADMAAAALDAKVRQLADLPLTDSERIHAARLILTGPGQ